MALVLADRVRETTAVVGTGTATLLGAIASYQSFAAIGNGNTVYYTIVDQTTGAWEVGIGTYTASGTLLSRDTVLSSSNGGALVNFPAGTKDVWGDYPAGKAVTTDTLAYPPAIGGTTPAAGTFTTLTATGQTSLGGAAGSESFRAVSVASSVSWVEAQGNTGAQPRILSNGSGADLNFAVSSKGTGAIRLFTNTIAQEQFRITHTASAVNFVQVTGSATGNNTTISAQGSDASVGLNILSKGSGSIFFNAGNTNRAQIDSTGGVNLAISASGGVGFKAVAIGSQVNFLQASGGIATNAPVLSAQGSDTNISQVFQSKGTGAIDLAAGSRGVNISNGGTVTAITGTSVGSGYTSFPTPALSAPTTAGGVQAVVAVVRMFNSGVTVANGGTGYTVGNVLTVTGGTPLSAAATLTVTTVSAGVITGISVTNQSTYTALPTSPVSVTGGSGSDATFNLTWGVVNGASGYSITNAGSGYVEQPTVTFSGGGGSGAAAYASVGSGTIIRSLGSTGAQSLDFYTPSSITSNIPALRLRDVSGADSYVMIAPTPSQAQIVVQGIANANLLLAANGSGSISLQTNGTSQTQQVRVTHTASAVNYVQVTGAVTGNQPVISTQGSDANVILNIASKGNASIIFNANSAEQFRTGATASAVNSLQLNGATTGNSPSLQARGSNTNIDLALTPKGTGNVRFGTFTTLGAEVITGYIEVKDSGGTIRKLAVIA